tara:strand:- start:861 stop:1403 length:543 start_codon:yes stop_codon:yes gene_type:complete
MKLRNGKRYSVLCYICKEHYGSEKQSACTMCKPGSSPQYSWKVIYCSEKFQKKLEKYKNSKVINSNEKYILKKMFQRYQMYLVADMFQNMKREDRYLDSEFANYLINNFGDGRTSKRLHLICPMVIDWWNITHKNGWGSTEVCYYGRFEEPWYHIVRDKFPPPKPNCAYGNNWPYECISY